jgi:Icc-related predicted phosphoesterase
MKCLLVSDLHYTLKQLDWVDRVSEGFDLVVIAGDHLDISSTVSLDAQVVVTLKYLRRFHAKTTLLVSSGNHDLTARDAANEKVAVWMSRVRQLGVPADGDRIDVGETTFTICPWWDGPVAHGRVDELLARDARERGRHWVWVYHSPPDDSPVSWAGQRHFGDADLLHWIRLHQPDMVLCGHIHQSPFRSGGSWVDQIGRTWVFNPGRQIGPIPTHIVLDTSEQRATWFSLAGNQFVPLDRPLVRPPAELQETVGSGSRSEPGEGSSP